MTCSIIKATEKDGIDMLPLFEQSDIPTSVELILTRRPNVFECYKKECENAEVYIAKTDDRIVFQIACLVREMYVNEKLQKVGYICGLRKEKGITKINVAELIGKIKYDCKCDIYYANVLKTNETADNILTRKHRAFEANEICEYSTFVLQTKNASAIKNGLRKANNGDWQRIVDFIMAECGNMDLLPCLSEFADLDFYLLEQNGEILCVCSLWEQSEFKQYIIKKYNGVLKLLSPFLPRTGTNMKSPFLSFFVAKNERIYAEMLKNMASVANAIYFTVGAIKGSILYDVLSKQRNVAKFDSTIYQIGFNKITEKISNSVYIDGGLL